MLDHGFVLVIKQIKQSALSTQHKKGRVDDVKTDCFYVREFYTYSTILLILLNCFDLYEMLM